MRLCNCISNKCAWKVGGFRPFSTSISSSSSSFLLTKTRLTCERKLAVHRGRASAPQPTSLPFDYAKSAERSERIKANRWRWVSCTVNVPAPLDWSGERLEDSLPETHGDQILSVCLLLGCQKWVSVMRQDVKVYPGVAVGDVRRAGFFFFFLSKLGKIRKILARIGIQNSGTLAERSGLKHHHLYSRTAAA